MSVRTSYSTLCRYIHLVLVRVVLSTCLYLSIYIYMNNQKQVREATYLSTRDQKTSEAVIQIAK